MLELIQGLDVSDIINIILSVATLIFGSGFLIYFGKVGAIGKLLVDFAEATKDKKVSKEEMELLKADLIAIIGQVRYDKWFGKKLE
jgi:cell division protein FtsB